MKPESYIEVFLQTSSENHEYVSWLALESGALGVEELESSNERVTLKLYFADQPESVDLAMKALETTGFVAVLNREHKEGQDWQAQWQQYFKPLQVGARFVVRPPWELNPWPERLDLVIGPAQGFGTGYHETTRLALIGLEGLSLEGVNNFLDVGFGSGILALGALKMGVPHGVGLEIESEPIEELVENLKYSGLEPNRLKGVLARPDQWQEPADLVLANITGDVLLHHEQDLKRLCNRYLVLSGIMQDYLEPLQEAFSDWKAISHNTEGDWHSLVFEVTP